MSTPKHLHPSEAANVTCDECAGVGCGECGWRGGEVRSTHSPESAVAIEEPANAEALRAALQRAVEALRGLEVRSEPGVFCDHAAAPCHRCDAAAAVLAEAERLLGGAT